MKKIKVLFLLLLLVLITGCTGTYNLNIDENLKVKEELNITIQDEASNYEKVDKLIKNEAKENDSYDLVIEGNDLKLNYTHEYDTIEDYLVDSIIYKQLFDHIEYNNEMDEITLSTGNIFNLSTSKLNNSYNIRLLQVNLTTPLEVIDENSDTISENTYSWTLDSKTKEKEMYIVLNSKNNKINIGTAIVLVTAVVVLIFIIVIVVRRLSDSRKI